MKQELRLLAFKFSKFIFVLALVDLSLGLISKKIYFGQETGKQARITHSIQNDSSDILIFGSSHANRHFVPEVISKKLNKSCYNVGVQGQGIVFHNVLQKIILKRTKPQVIILNMDNNWLYERKDAYDRLSDLYPYYNEFKKQINPALSLNAKFASIKLQPKGYQYNSTLVHAARYFISPQKDFQGYLPLTGVMTKPKNSFLNTEKKSNEILPLDINFITAFKSFIATTKKNNIKLYITISPVLKKRNLASDVSLNRLKSIALSENIPLIDYYNNKLFLNQYHLFNDSDHLNHEGAQEFSSLISDYIRNIPLE